MARERTLSIIKPGAVARNITGKVNTKIEDAGLSIVASKMLRMSRVQAGDFYEMHKGKSFYDDLIEFMTSGPVIVQVLEGDDAVAVYRKIMGATKFGEAEPGTIRAEFATSTQKNVVHGADSKKSAKREIKFFFAQHEIFSRE